MTVSCTLPQLTPSPKVCPLASTEFASPTPTIEPISVCELEAGSPKYHVPTFQMIAEIRSANTIANPAARADVHHEFDRQQGDDAERDRAAREQHADEVPAARPDDRDRRPQGVGVDDGGDRVRRVVKPVHAFEAERQAESDDEENRASNSQSAAE